MPSKGAAREESGDAAGLYNMARNLGGSVGLAIISTVIDRRNDFHTAAIRELLTANSRARAGSHGGERGAFRGAERRDIAHAKM